MSRIVSQPPPSTSIDDGPPWLTVQQPDTNYIGADHGPNYPAYGHHHYDPYDDNVWYGSEGPPLAAVCFAYMCISVFPPC